MFDSSENARKGVLSAIYEYKNRKIVGGEILLIAIVCGVYFASWWIFGGVLAGCILMFSIRILSFLLCAVLTLAWGIIGYAIGTEFSVAAGYVLGGVGLLLGYGIHFSIRH